MSDEEPFDETQVTGLSTVDSGKPPEAVDEPSRNVDTDALDLTQSALANAQRVSRASDRVARRRAQARRDNRRRGGYSGPGPDERDPQSVKQVSAGLFAERGWDHPIAEARVFADWPSLVGSEIAAHCQPVSLREGELRLAAESTAWATQLRLLAATLLARLAAELGPKVVAKIYVSGPIGPTWKHGPRSVRGARGPRDTYG